MAARRSGGTPATLVLAAAGVTFGEHSYAHDPAAPAYGLEAAAALGAVSYTHLDVYKRQLWGRRDPRTVLRYDGDAEAVRRVLTLSLAP